MPPDQNDESQVDESVEDPIKNLKGEFNRKLSAQESALNSLRESNERLVAIMQGLIPAKQEPQQQESDSSDLDPYDPGFAQKVAKRAEQAASRVMSEQNEKNRVVGELMSRYPDLQDMNSDLHKKTAALYDQMPKTASNMELATLKAASELGVSPMSKNRKPTVHGDDDDTFVMPSSRNRDSNNQQSDRDNKKGKLSEKSLAIAQLMGLDIEDKVQVARIEKRAQRKVWSKYGK